MSRTIPSLATVGRAYLSGRCAALRAPGPLQQHWVAAWELGRSADPREPLPESVLAAVVARLARPTVEELNDPADTCRALAGTTRLDTFGHSSVHWTTCWGLLDRSAVHVSSRHVTTSRHVTATGQRLWPTRSLASGGAWPKVAQWGYPAGALSGRLWRRCSPPSNRTKPSVARAPVDCRAVHRLGVSGRRQHAGASVPVAHPFSLRIRSPMSAPAMSARKRNA